MYVLVCKEGALVYYTLCVCGGVCVNVGAGKY